MPDNNVTAKQYVDIDALSAFLDKIKYAYAHNEGSEKFTVQYAGAANTAASATSATSATTAGSLANDIVFKDSNNNTIGTWTAGETNVVLTVSAGGNVQDVLRFKGFKPNRAALDNLAAEVGDVWVIDDGTEYVWTPAIEAEGEEGEPGYVPGVDAHWEKLGINTDLSAYITSATAEATYVKKVDIDHVTTEDINELFEDEEEEPNPEPGQGDDPEPGQGDDPEPGQGDDPEPEP